MRALLSFILFFLLTVFMTRPLIFQLGGPVVGWVPGDNGEYLWKIWWFKRALVDLGVSPFYNPDIYYPYGFNLAYGEVTPYHTLGMLPLTILFGEVVSHNFSVFLSFLISGFGMYLLVVYFTKDDLAGVLSGVAFAFCPYRYAQTTNQLPMGGTQWLPFFLLYLEKTLRERKKSKSALAGLFYALGGFSSWYYAVFALVLAVAYLLVRARPWRKYLSDRRLWLCAGVFFALVAILLGPFLWPYWELRVRGEARHPFHEVDVWSASLSDYFIPNALHPLWGHLVRRFLLPNTAFWVSCEFFVHWGFLPTLLALFALREKRGKLTQALGFVAFLAIILSLGTTLHFHGRRVYFPAPAEMARPFNDFLNRLAREGYPPPPGNAIAIPLPGFFLHFFVPPFNSMRVWSRFGFLADFAVFILAGIGLAKWIKSGSISRRGVALAFCALTLFEFLTIPLPMVELAPRPVDLWLAQKEGDFAIIQLPLEAAKSGPQMYYTKFNAKKLASGYGTYFPSHFTAHEPELESFPQDRALDVLARWGVRYVLLSEDDYRKQPSIWKEIASQKRLELATIQGGIRVYRLLR